MATEPSFASTIALGAALLGSAETNLQVPVNASVIVTAGASGTKIEEVRVAATTTSLVATTVAGLVYLFIYDGSTYSMIDTITISAITASATTSPSISSRTYTNLLLPTTWSLRAAQSIAGNASILKVSAFGGHF